MVSINLESNVIRGEMKDEILDKTIKEIHDVIATVFGPYATDAYLIKDGKDYYTRDGKEVLASMAFSNPVAERVKNIILQAVMRQSVKIGDGTTTLAVLYTNIYLIIRNIIMNEPDNLIAKSSLTDIRDVWNDIVECVIEDISEFSSKDIDKETFASLVYTCTQDRSLTQYITDSLMDKISEGALVTISRSASDEEMTVDVHDKPLIKASYICSSKPMPEGKFNGTVLFVNGPINFASFDSYVMLASSLINAKPGNVIILCNGLDEISRKSFKEYLSAIKVYYETTPKNDKSYVELNNLIFMKIEGLNMYPTEAVEDLVAMVYDVEGIPGMVKPMTFESLVYQAFDTTDPTQKNANSSDRERLTRYDFPLKDLMVIKKAFTSNYCEMEYSEIYGLSINKKLGEVATKRLADLREAIDREKSGVKRAEYIKRLKSIYGQFVEVSIGSKLMKDETRKYELALDAIVSATNAVTFGVLHENSISRAISCVNDIMSAEEPVTKTDKLYVECYKVIAQALTMTLCDMIRNKFSDIDYSTVKDMIEDYIGYFDLNVETPDDLFYVPTSYNGNYMCIGNLEFNYSIVEPLHIIIELLSNSIMMVELAKAKVFSTNKFIGNYL